MTPTPCPSCEEARAETERLRTENVRHRENYCGPEREAFNEAVMAADPTHAGRHFLVTATEFVQRALGAESALAEVTRERDALEAERDEAAHRAEHETGTLFSARNVAVAERDAALARVAALEGALGRLLTEWDVPANDRIERERQSAAIESAFAAARALLPGMKP